MVGLRALVPALIAIAALSVAAQPAPLPEQEPFFAEVRKRLASNDLILSRYSYRERSTELKLNPFGRMGTGVVEVYEVYPHPNDELTYRRLIERDGKKVPPAELAREDAAYQRRLAAWERRAGSQDPGARLARLRKAEADRQRDEARARDAIDALTFTITGRDTWDGQPAILIDFVPRPDARPRTREGRIAHAFAGRAWVHEHEFEVMNVEARALNDVSFGFGMVARLHKGLTARFTRRRINGVWLPVETHFQGHGRAFLLRRLEIDFSRYYENYRPFEPADLPARLGWLP